MASAQIYHLPRPWRTKADLEWVGAIADCVSDDPEAAYATMKSAVRQIDGRLERGGRFESDGAITEAAVLALYASAKILGISSDGLRTVLPTLAAEQD